MATKTEDYLGITDYKVIGTRPIRHDGVDKVVGRAKYGADIDMAGMLHGAGGAQPACPCADQIAGHAQSRGPCRASKP